MDLPRTNEEMAYHLLRDLLLRGELPVGKFLSQRMLCERAGVAEVTVRPALRLLQNEGLIEYIPRWGVRVPIETEDSLRDRYFMREVLEVAAFKRVIELNNPLHKQGMLERAQKCDSVGVEGQDGIEQFAQLHFELHHFMTQCSGSNLLVESLERIHLKIRMFYNAKRAWGRGLDRASHVNFIQDIFSGDAEHAEHAIRMHVRRGLEHELEAIHEMKASGSLSPAR
jgi:DNA-binding GntR family transcriptional regulator